MLHSLFVRDGRLRSGWRLVSYIVVSRVLFLALGLAVTLAVMAYLFAHGIPASESESQIPAIVTDLRVAPVVPIGLEAAELAVTAGIIYLWRHWLDKRTFRSLGTELSPGWWSEFLAGAGLIALAWGAIFVVSLATSAAVIQGIRLDPAQLVTDIGLGLILNLLVGFFEELDARGYILQTLESGVGFVPAVLLSALFFGAQHLLNPGANLASLVGTTLFGVLAAIAYWATGRLWMPIGMHSAWNLLEGPVVGFLVSGLDMGGLFDLSVRGPEWLTGGSFGPEAGALSWVPLVVLIIVLYLWGRKRRLTANA